MVVITKEPAHLARSWNRGNILLGAEAEIVPGAGAVPNAYGSASPVVTVVREGCCKYSLATALQRKSIIYLGQPNAAPNLPESGSYHIIYISIL